MPYTCTHCYDERKVIDSKNVDFRHYYDPDWGEYFEDYVKYKPCPFCNINSCKDCFDLSQDTEKSCNNCKCQTCNNTKLVTYHGYEMPCHCVCKNCDGLRLVGKIIDDEIVSVSCPDCKNNKKIILF